MNSGGIGVCDTRIAAAFWLLVAGTSRIAHCPRVLPSPIIARRTVPAVCSRSDEPLRAVGEMVSLVDLIRQNATSPLLTQGIPPPQRLRSEREGVEPVKTSKS